MNMRSIRELPVNGKRILVRADLNVPFNDGKITDTTRIDRFACGMQPLLESGARLVVLTHMGRPDPENPDKSLSTRQLLAPLAAALDVRRITFAESCTTEQTQNMAMKLLPGEVMLCENLRFHPGETENDPDFAAKLARLGDVYVNDAFSCSHRAHASIETLAHLLPASAGPLLTEEINALTQALDTPDRPAIAIVGGAKISTKIDVLTNLTNKLDTIIIGGAMANTFLAARGASVGRSLHEPQHIPTANEVMAHAARTGCSVELPVDAVCATALETNATTITTPVDQCPPEMMILDAGPQSLTRFKGFLKQARTMVWNGPVGAFETPPFDNASIALAHVTAQLTSQKHITSVAGGGDTVAALNAAGVLKQFSYVSTAGGAFLEWLEGRQLPGLNALNAKSHARKHGEMSCL